jgi:hypothetical protein
VTEVPDSMALSRTARQPSASQPIRASKEEPMALRGAIANRAKAAAAITWERNGMASERRKPALSLMHAPRPGQKWLAELVGPAGFEPATTPL